VKLLLGLIVLAAALGSCAVGPAREQDLVGRALDAMGGQDAVTRVKTVSAQGTVKHWEPEQSDIPGGDMRFAAESKFEFIADYTVRAVRVNWEKNFAYPTPRTFKFSEIVTPDAGYVIGVDSNGRNAQSLANKPPAHSMSGLRLAAAQREYARAVPRTLLLEMRNNPDRVHAAANVVVGAVAYPALRYDAGGASFIVAFDPKTGLPARARTLDYDNIWGDVNFDTVYADWREFSGVRVPTAQTHELNGRVVAESRLADVRFNITIAPDQVSIPQAIQATARRPARGQVPYQWVIRRQYIGVYLDSDHVSYDTQGSPGLRFNEIAPGVQHVVGGSHNSMLVEMADHLIAFDAPIDDAQSIWTISAAKAKYPNKPIRYLVLTHHHMDHAGGLRAYLAQGATLVVGQGAGNHFRRVLAAPFARNPNLRPQDLSRAPILEVADRYVMTDGKRQVSAHLTDNPHSKAYLIGYVADARLGYVTDIWSPGAAPLPGKITSPLAALVNATRQAGIQPLRFAGGHGSTSNFAPLADLAGK
jgi:glyoxylase-like metal-dependent hydrolase (beta-lactamase superfamily II)